MEAQFTHYVEKTSSAQSALVSEFVGVLASGGVTSLILGIDPSQLSLFATVLLFSLTATVTAFTVIVMKYNEYNGRAGFYRDVILVRDLRRKMLHDQRNDHGLEHSVFLRFAREMLDKGKQVDKPSLTQLREEVRTLVELVRSLPDEPA